jgi:hypothetical protein
MISSMAGLWVDQSLIDLQIFPRHPRGAESALEGLAAPRPADLPKPCHCFDCRFYSVADEPADALVDHLLDRPATKRDDRRPARHRLDQYQSERLRPLDREQECRGFPEELALMLLADLTDVSDVGLSQ